jgi:hypothetical protein
VAAGYFLGQANKNKEVEQAKQSAQQTTQDVKKNTSGSNSTSPSSNQAVPSKTVTETTCNADELELSVQDSAESGAGTIAYDLIFTNVGTRECILGGFPGVSLVNENGNMVGAPAERAKNYTEKKLTLAPKTQVKAVVSTANSTNFTDGQCKEGATKFRVYPPSDTGYLSAMTSVGSWCPGFTISPVLSM